MFCVLGLPWPVVTKAQFQRENNVEALKVAAINDIDLSTSMVPPLNRSTIKLQLIQRTPIQFRLCVLLNGLRLFRLANAIAISVAARMRWQVKQEILAYKRREVDRLRPRQLGVHGKCGHSDFVREFF